MKVKFLFIVFCTTYCFTVDAQLPFQFVPVTKEKLNLHDSIYFVETKHSLVRGSAKRLSNVRKKADLPYLTRVQIYEQNGNILQHNAGFSTHESIHIDSKIYFKNGYPDSSLLLQEQATKMYRENVAVFDVNATPYFVYYSGDTTNASLSTQWDSSGVTIKKASFKLYPDSSFYHLTTKGRKMKGIDTTVHKKLSHLLHHIQFLRHISFQLRIAPPNCIPSVMEIVRKTERVVYEYDQHGNWTDRYLINKRGRVLFHSSRVMTYY